MKTEDIIAEISDLPVEERARIADSILRTLNKPDPEIDAHWMKVVERREKEVESGEAKMLSRDEFDKEVEKFKENFPK